MKQSFLHERCKVSMCQDCIDLAEEYQEIEVRRRAEMIRPNWEDVARTWLHGNAVVWLEQEIDRIIKS